MSDENLVFWCTFFWVLCAMFDPMITSAGRGRR